MWHFLHKLNMILKFFNATLKILQGLHIYLKILALYIVKIESHFFRNILVKINKCSPWKKITKMISIRLPLFGTLEYTYKSLYDEKIIYKPFMYSM